MAKKVTRIFTAEIKKNNVKGGAWMASFSVHEDGVETVDMIHAAAWANASAAKRWLKENVVANTPRKSIKMVAGTDLDVKGKPLSFSGSLTYRQ
jgi:hypothetical protein